MAGVITTGAHPKALWPGVHKFWGIEYAQYKPIWPQMFEKLTSDMAYEEEVEDTGFGLMSRKPEGQGITYDTAHQGTVARYVHVTYAQGFIVTWEQLNDNLYPKISFRSTARLARSAAETEEVVHASVFNRAFTSSFAGGDGKELCATDHPTVNGTQSNELAIAADLSEASLEDMSIMTMNMTNSRGLRIMAKTRSLLVPTALKFEAIRILQSVLQNDTANNAVNALKAAGEMPDGIICNPYLDDPDAYFVRTTVPDGTKHFTRAAISFDKDNDFDTKNAKAAAIGRWSQGWTDWRQWIGTPGA